MSFLDRFYAGRHNHSPWFIGALFLAVLLILGVLIGAARADDFADRFNGKIQCPDPGVKCKVLFLTEQEERILTGQNGILDTAAQGRSLDLGQFAVYFKQKISSAPSGEPQKPATVPVPASPSQNNSADPVDKK